MPNLAQMLTQVSPRKSRKDSKYNAEERKAIDPFKETYRSQTTRDGRLMVLKTQILPAMFNYWSKAGEQLRNKEDEVSRARVNI